MLQPARFILGVHGKQPKAQLFTGVIPFNIHLADPGPLVLDFGQIQTQGASVDCALSLGFFVKGTLDVTMTSGQVIRLTSGATHASGFINIVQPNPITIQLRAVSVAATGYVALYNQLTEQFIWTL